jgi:hypothetical protein
MNKIIGLLALFLIVMFAPNVVAETYHISWEIRTSYNGITTNYQPPIIAGGLTPVGIPDGSPWRCSVPAIRNVKWTSNYLMGGFSCVSADAEIWVAATCNLSEINDTDYAYVVIGNHSTDKDVVLYAKCITTR